MASALWCSDNEEEKEEKEEKEEEKEEEEEEEEAVRGGREGEEEEGRGGGGGVPEADKRRPSYKENLIRTAVAYCPGASCTSYLDSQLLTAMKSAIVAPFAGDNCPLWRSKGIAAWTMDRKFLAFVQQTVSSIVRRRKMLERRALTMA
ncbi:hypothetical protein HZH68_009715 [Vespula germanica]|uniref:Uncharacterized protein n=1 Tax=Vespula germanica TaxID=30212 RepID=A0A834JX03_VESGE|nr:hypothetical protein HZH68_009715 [Vespula germanica]